MLDVLPPKIDISLITKIRLEVLAGVIDELTRDCGVSIKDSLERGIVERDVIKKIAVRFMDSPVHCCAKIIFVINWDRFEYLVKTDDGSVLFSNLDTKKRISTQLDKSLSDAVKVYVERTKRKYKIQKVECTYTYREKYTETESIHKAAREYMHHITCDEKVVTEINDDFTNELHVAFKGLQDVLTISFEI